MKNTNKAKKEMSIDFVHSEMKRFKIMLNNDELSLKDCKTFLKCLSISLKYYKKKWRDNPNDPEVLRYFKP